MIRTSEMFTVPPRPRGGQPVREGLRWVVGRRDMALLFGVLVVVSMFAFNYSVSLPKLADERWGGEDDFGWVLAVTSIGSLTGSLLTARLRRVPMNWMLINMVDPRRRRHRHGVGAEHLASRSPGRSRVGVGGAGFITAANAISQQESPSDMRSRLMALQAVAFLGSTPIGGPITGWIADVGERAVVAGVRRRDQPGCAPAGRGPTWRLRPLESRRRAPTRSTRRRSSAPRSVAGRSRGIDADRHARLTAMSSRPRT